MRSPAGKKVAACRSSLAGAHELGLRGFSVGRVDWHREHLIAGNAFALVHEDQIFVVRRKIRLGIGPAKRELANVTEVLLGRQTRRSRRFFSVAHGLRVARHEREIQRVAGRKTTAGRNAILAWLISIYFLCSSFTDAAMGLPSRSTFTSTTSPTLLRRNASVKSYKFLIGMAPN